MTGREWEMIEFLIQFLYLFMIINTVMQATAKSSLSNTWVIYEKLFDNLNDVKKAFNDLNMIPDWLEEVQFAVEKIWIKFRKYYDKTAKSFAYIDAIILHLILKKKFMKKTRYEVDFIEKYIREMKSRFQRHYDIIRRIVLSHRSLQRGKWQHLSSSDSNSSNGMKYNEFTSYMDLKRDSSVTDALSW